ncbi:MAG: oligoendopeptidase F family protein, partial [Clostridia bacterium]|nr:oligoendopeptidase F family protein [Clostridia bacterium]
MENLYKILTNYSVKFKDKENLLERFKKFEQDEIKIIKLAHFISHSLNVDSSNTKMLALSQKFDNLYTKMNEANAFFMPQMYELSDDYLNSLLKDDRFKNYDNTIKEIIKLKPHKVDEKTNTLLSKMGTFLGNNSNLHSILTDSEMYFDDAVDSKGKKHKVDNSTAPVYLSSTDKMLRKTTFESRMNAFEKLNKTFAELYLKDVELDKFNYKLKNYNSLLEEVLLSEDVPQIVFDNNIKFVNKYIPLLQQYVTLRKKISKDKTFAYYDLFEDIKSKQKITLEKAHELVLSAVAPIGEEYVNLVKNKLNDKSIDYMPNANKNSGAYCSSCYDAKTLILMNYDHDFDSVSTLIHEMGHCINAEYFNASQPREKAEISIFAAEIASTTNEILLNLFMQTNANKKDKAYYISTLLDGMRSTIFRQTLFSEFELYAHDCVDKEIPITYEDLNKKYFELSQKYYGKSCILPKALQYEWSRIPHFYNAYYVYSYSTGMITAITLAYKLLHEKDFYKQYVKFLKNGTEKPTVEILKEIGVDLTTDEPFETAFKFMREQLEKLKELSK